MPCGRVNEEQGEHLGREREREGETQWLLGWGCGFICAPKSRQYKILQQQLHSLCASVCDCVCLHVCFSVCMCAIIYASLRVCVCVQVKLEAEVRLDLLNSFARSFVTACTYFYCCCSSYLPLPSQPALPFPSHP